MRGRSTLTTLLLGLAAVAAAAQPTPAGDPFDLPEVLERYQTGGAVAYAPGGRFVAVWESFGQDGSGSGILGRRFARDGSPLGDEFLVNVAPTDSQFGPAVAVAADGSFLVAWVNPSAGPYYYDVYARAYDAAGNPFGLPFRVHTYSFGEQSDPQLIVSPEGGYLATWQGAGEGGTYGIFGRRIDDEGVPLGAPFHLDLDGGYPGNASFGALASDDFVVGYSAYLEEYTSAILGQRFTGAGDLVGPSFRVDDLFEEYSYVDFPALAADGEGEFVVAWVFVGDTNVREVHARRFDAEGQPLEGEFVVGENDYDYYGVNAPQVARSPAGEFVVVWQGPDYAGVRARAYLDDGTADGGEFGVHSPDDYGWDGRVAIDDLGEKLFVWTTWRKNTETDVVARRYDAAELLFADGFESGDTGAWSDTLPRQPLAGTPREEDRSSG